MLGQEHLHLIAPSDTGAVMQLLRKGSALIYTHTDSALAFFTRAEALSRASGFSDGVGLALAQMGLAATTLGAFDKGFEYYRQALPYCRQAKVLRAAPIHLYANMATSWGDQENYAKANAYYHRALRLIEERFPDDGRFLIPVYNNLISVQVYMGSIRQAFLYADRAIALAVRDEQWATLAQVLLNKGDIYFSQKHYDSAMVYYDQAARFVHQAQEKSLTKSYYQRMSDVLIETGRYPEALGYLEKAKALKAYSRPLSEITLDYTLGDILYRLGKNREAESVLLAALAKAQATGLTKNRQNGHAVLMALYRDEGRFEEAFEQQRAYLRLSESILQADKVRAVNEIEIKYQVAEKNKALVENELEISRQNRTLYRKNIIIAGSTGSIILLVFSGIAFYRYKQKLNVNAQKVTRLTAMMSGEEKERVRLARELHDGVGGMLTGIKLKLGSLQCHPDSIPLRRNLAELLGMLKQTEEEIRLAAHNLMPDTLVKHGLKEALQQYGEHLSAEGSLKIDIQFYGALDLLDRNFELQLYRIIQELLQNILRHAKARYAAIQIQADGGKIRVSVEDDGIGFDVQRESSGLGLRNLEARINALNGAFSIASAPEVGTTVYLEFNPVYQSSGS